MEKKLPILIMFVKVACYYTIRFKKTGKFSNTTYYKVLQN